MQLLLIAAVSVWWAARKGWLTSLETTINKAWTTIQEKIDEEGRGEPLRKAP